MRAIHEPFSRMAVLVAAAILTVVFSSPAQAADPAQQHVYAQQQK